MAISIGVDIGGTFTDLVAAQDGHPWVSLKVPSTPRDPSHGVRNAVRRLIGHTPIGTTAVVRFIHGTTVATNALLEGCGARVGLLTTAGFEDTLEIGRQLRSRDYLYSLEPPVHTPTFLVPRSRRLGVSERVDASGTVVEPLDLEGVERAARRLVSHDHVEAIAVCFLFSFLNPEHEQRTRTLLEELYPHLDIALSCEVDPVAREYERLCMTLTDAYIRPVVSSYIRRLERSLDAHGIDAPLQIMQSRGGIAAAGNALRRPVSLVASGPAAGVLGAAVIAERCGIKDAVTIDIGGTSSDVAIVVGSRPLFRRGGVVRGLPLRMTTVDVDSIGAGGGSIAWIDSAGGLRVGPRSAGADPGPACYGRGGTDATVTDASVVLGYLNPEYFAGGTVALDADRSRAAIAALASRLGLGPVETALGIHRVVNARMADQIRLRSLRRGYDPRRFALVVLGGAGATHGIDLAVDLGIPRVVVPPAPGVLSAYGLLLANVEHEQISSFAARVDEADPAEIERNLRALEEQVRTLMVHESVTPESVLLTRSADMRYVGQSYELEVLLDGGKRGVLIDSAIRRFHRAHESVYGHMSPTAPVEFVNLCVSGVAPASRLEDLPHGDGKAGPSIPTGQRTLYSRGHPGGTVAPVLRRDELAVGGRVAGPAVIEQEDTTCLINAGWSGTVHSTGVLILTEE
ncbi:MAG TPA: hydantoinase/oxoprolinase family protein [Solirubrobacteraceae bacterium]